MRVCVNRVAVLLAHRSSVGAGACRCSVPMKLLTASGGLHLIGIPGNSRWKECSILRAAVYDLDKLAFARFQREKRTGGGPGDSNDLASFQPRIFTSSIIRTSSRKLPLHVQREIRRTDELNSLLPKLSLPVKFIKIQKLIIKLVVAAAPRDEVVRRRSKLFLVDN